MRFLEMVSILFCGFFVVFEERERKDMMCSELWDEMDEGKLGAMHRDPLQKTLPVPNEFALTTSILLLPLRISDAPLAQWIERLTTDQEVVGSNPSRRAMEATRMMGYGLYRNC